MICAAFNGKLEYGTPPEPLNEEEVLHIVEDINYIWGSKNGGSVGENDGDRYIVEIPGKNKDEIAARLDLLNMGVKIDLQPEYGQRRTRLPPGPWNLSRAEKRAVCNSFYGMKVPEDSRLLGLKSHDCHTLMQQLLPVAICSVLEKPARTVLVRKVALLSVGVPSSQKMGILKPLSGFIVSLVDRDLLNQAHLYVLENTEEVLLYREHMIHIKTTYPKFRKRTKWLQDKHNSTFIQWLHFKVQSELNGEEHNGAQDDVRTIQNSGVYLLAHTMQVASAKDKNPIVSNMGFYGVIQEIWDLDYQKFRIPVLRCDWIDNTSGLIVDELGFTLVDLSKIGHRNDQFVMASQVKQVFYVDDPMHRGWSVVLSMPSRKYNDVIGDDVLGDTRIECEPFTIGIPNVDTFDDLVGFGHDKSKIKKAGLKL
ncbi:hypothetical protein Prudu_013164 [Prunus dulcis]|uniref:DUF4216 domain-containing protein n=1 Tax=Prunus dulcis TaxID=3755 RepID=A0A4Y1RF28_PRUDU|nr:hypothetical protein Prudu_013164 [Prunus dulcis]